MNPDMIRKIPLWPFGVALCVMAVAGFAWTASAALFERVNEAFGEVYGRDPSRPEWDYWAGRVVRGEKKTYQDLVGAIAFGKAKNKEMVLGVVSKPSGSVVVASASFKTDQKYYPSPVGPNVLPDGTLIRKVKTNDIFYVKGGKRSWILPSIASKWFAENHYFKSDIAVTLTAEDFARYPQVSSVNKAYVGKVLQHPSGTQYFIDDKLRKRVLPAAVRSKFRIPAGNLYTTSDVHLKEFATGPQLTGDKYPGGMVIYTGAWHGGQMWKIEEVAGGKLVKRLYLSDYIYEADYNPDESLRAAADPKILVKHERGANIERYPDGYIVGLNGKVFVVGGQALRHITSAKLFAAMGYEQKYVWTVFPEFLKRYPQGQPINAFKSITNGNMSGASAPKAAPNTASTLTKVRPEIRALIAEVNTLYINAYDKDPTVAENKFWVDYLYNGEVNNKTDLVAAMKRAAQTGKKPGITSRTSQISEEKLERHWFPYLFYFVHQKDPSEDDKDYWYDRIKSGDRDTIEKLGGTLQWMKDNLGKTRR